MKTELHRRETATHTNLLHQALTETTKKKKDEHKAPSNGDCDANWEFPIVIRKDERKAPPDGECDTNREFPTVKRKDERRALLDGDCDTNREFTIVKKKRRTQSSVGQRRQYE